MKATASTRRPSAPGAAFLALTIMLVAGLFWSGQAAAGPGKQEDVLPNGCHRITVFDFPRKGVNRVTMYCPDAYGNLQQVRQPRDYAISWIGRLPTEEIDNQTFFLLVDDNFPGVVSRGEAPTTEYFAAAPPVSIVYGHVRALSTRGCEDLTQTCQSGGTFLYFPFCLAGECSDPDVGSRRLAVYYFDENYFTDNPPLVTISAPRPTGARICQGTGRFSEAECFDEAGSLPVILPAQMDAYAVYIFKEGNDRLGERIDAALDYFNKHYDCNMVTADLMMDGASWGTKSRLVCNYRP